MRKFKLKLCPGKFVWNAESLDIHSEKIQSVESRHNLHTFFNEHQSNCDNAVKTFPLYYVKTASVSANSIKSQARTHKQKHKVKKKQWFSESCYDLHKVVKKYAYLVESFLFNVEHRKAFYSYRSKFRRLCKAQKRKIKQNICEDFFQYHEV